MNKLVCWSGGCDSTLCLYDLAAKSSKASPVHSIAINHGEVGAEIQQKKARVRLLARFKKLGFHIQHTEITIRTKGDFYISGHGIVQPSIWLPFAMLYARKKDDLIFGYIRGDDVWHHKLAIEYIHQYAQSLNHNEGKLVFPLEWMTKAEVIKRLRELKLLKLVWWCERPTKKGRPCKECGCCVVHQVAVYQLEKYGETK